MKKSVILLASAILLISCDVPAGGNKGRIVKTDDVVRYDDPNAPHGTYEANEDTVKSANKITEAVKVESTESKETEISKPEASNESH